jgi:ribA/ribD-fused uncharacterized protein
MKIINGYCLFWREFLSNWKESPFTIDFIRYNCVEQYMMAEKARTFNDIETLNKILGTKIPKEQKDFGRAVKNYDDAKWNEIRYQVVLNATIEKYKQNPELKEKLLAIDCDTFVEASPYDTIWGIGMDESNPDAANEKTWLGLNLLGKAITEARNILK